MTTKPTPIGNVAPYLDEASFDAVDDAIRQLADRRGVWLDDVGLIHVLASLISHAEACLPLAVAAAREDGTGWEDIARLLGIPATQAEATYDPGSPMVDTRSPYSYQDLEDQGLQDRGGSR